MNVNDLTINQHAQLEIDRRGLDKANPARKHVGGDLDLPVAHEATTMGCFRMGGTDLKALAKKARKSAARKAPAVKAARPTGVGSRGGDPEKARRMEAARKTAAKQGIVPFQGDREATAKFWAIYSATK